MLAIFVTAFMLSSFTGHAERFAFPAKRLRGHVERTKICLLNVRLQNISSYMFTDLRKSS